VLDIDPPERARIIGSVALPFNNHYVHGQGDLAVDGDVACVLSGSTFITSHYLAIISIEDPENPVIAKVFYNPDNWTFFPRVVAKNGYAYVANWHAGSSTLVIDINPPEDAHIVTTLPYRGACQGISPDNKLYCYGNNGIAVYDLADPANPQYLASGVDLGNIRGFDVRNNYAWVGIQDSIKVVDVSDPMNMHVANETPVLFEPRRLKAMGGFLFAPADELGLWIAQIFPPGTIEPVFNLEMPEFHFKAVDVATQNGYMYVTTESADANGLRIYKWW
jgi:hypothetical protein